MKHALALCLMLTACGGGDSAPGTSAWTIGPDNYSVGMPTHPDTVGEGFAFDFPMQPGHVNYVTRQGLTLTGAHAIHAVFQIDAAPGTQFLPKEQNGEQGIASLYFQRRGDDWSGDGKFNFYRWWSSEAFPIAIGRTDITIPLDTPWGSVYGGSAPDHPTEFADAKANVDNVGIVFGWSAGRGHGVFATAPARLTMITFEVL